eukprot:Nk52_evm24s295 gene=Nk52_evmTU24s295
MSSFQAGSKIVLLLVVLSMSFRTMASPAPPATPEQQEFEKDLIGGAKENKLKIKYNGEQDLSGIVIHSSSAGQVVVSSGQDYKGTTIERSKIIIDAGRKNKPETYERALSQLHADGDKAISSADNKFGKEPKLHFAQAFELTFQRKASHYDDCTVNVVLGQGSNTIRNDWWMFALRTDSIAQRVDGTTMVFACNNGDEPGYKIQFTGKGVYEFKFEYV